MIFVICQVLFRFFLRFVSSNPSTRRKIENRSHGNPKKAEKSLEISAFLVFFRSDLNRPKDLSCPYKIDPQSKFFRNRSVFRSQRIDLSLGDDGSCTPPLSSGGQRHVCNRSYVFIQYRLLNTYKIEKQLRRLNHSNLHFRFHPHSQLAYNKWNRHIQHLHYAIDI